VAGVGAMMPLRRALSFALGLPVVATFALAVVYAIPRQREVSQGFSNHLFLWRAADTKLEAVSPGPALLTTDVERGADGSIFVMRADHSGVLVFDPARAAFGPVVPRPTPAPMRPAIEFKEFQASEYAVSGGDEDRGTFLRLETFYVRATGMTARRSALFRHGAWSRGPTVTALAARIGEEQHLTPAVLGGARLALLVEGRDHSRGGQSLFVAGDGDRAFHDVPLHGKLWPGSDTLDVVAGDGDRLLVVTSDVYANGPSAATHVIDVATGEVSNGPAIPGPGGGVTGQALPGGGLLGAGASEKVGVHNDALLANVAAALYLGLALGGLGWGLRTRRLEPTAFATGLAGGVLMALAWAWHAITHLGHLW